MSKYLIMDTYGRFVAPDIATDPETGEIFTYYDCRTTPMGFYTNKQNAIIDYNLILNANNNFTKNNLLLISVTPDFLEFIAKFAPIANKAIASLYDNRVKWTGTNMKLDPQECSIIAAKKYLGSLYVIHNPTGLYAINKPAKMVRDRYIELLEERRIEVD